MICRHIIFEGRVQGVGFRYTCRQLAMGFDLTGTVANLPDGSVEMQLCGEEEEVRDYLDELTEDSPMRHHIKEVRVTDQPVPEEAFRGFNVLQ